MFANCSTIWPLASQLAGHCLAPCAARCLWTLFVSFLRGFVILRGRPLERALDFVLNINRHWMIAPQPAHHVGKDGAPLFLAVQWIVTPCENDPAETLIFHRCSTTGNPSGKSANCR